MDEQAKLYLLFEKETLPHMDALYSFALRMTGNEKDADSLLLKTYKKAYWFFDKIEKDADYKTWLFRVMKNTFSNSYSKKTKVNEESYSEFEKLYENIKASFPENSCLEREIYNNLTDEEINGALFFLPEDFRMVIIFCDIDHFNYEQIAELVDIPAGTVISRLYRGRKMFFVKLYQCAEQKGYSPQK